jgi:hypothetical protein
MGPGTQTTVRIQDIVRCPSMTSGSCARAKATLNEASLISTGYDNAYPQLHTESWVPLLGSNTVTSLHCFLSKINRFIDSSSEGPYGSIGLGTFGYNSSDH